jgi:hypothetical protein
MGTASIALLDIAGIWWNMVEDMFIFVGGQRWDHSH